MANFSSFRLERQLLRSQKRIANLRIEEAHDRHGSSIVSSIRNPSDCVSLLGGDSNRLIMKSYDNQVVGSYSVSQSMKTISIRLNFGQF